MATNNNLYTTQEAVNILAQDGVNVLSGGGGGGGTGGGSTATVTSVGDTTTSTALKAANASRAELEVFNDSSAILYLLKGTGTASSTNFTAKVLPQDYYSTTFKGAVQGVWASDAGGSALVTESV